MANAVVGDYGDVLSFPTGQDLTDASALYVYCTKPDGTLVTKTNADGVTDGGAPTLKTIYWTIPTGFLDKSGDYRFSCGFTRTAGPLPTGIFSAGGFDVYTVIERNQSI